MHNHAKPAWSSATKASSRAGFSSGGFVEKWSTSSLPDVVVRIHFVVAVGLRVQASCWLWAKGHLQTVLGSLSDAPPNMASYYCKANRKRTSSKTVLPIRKEHSNDISHLCHVLLFRNKFQVCLHSRGRDYTKAWTPLFRWGIMGLTLECQPQMDWKGEKKWARRKREGKYVYVYITYTECKVLCQFSLHAFYYLIGSCYYYSKFTKEKTRIQRT